MSNTGNKEGTDTHKNFENLLQELRNNFEQSVSEETANGNGISERYLIFRLGNESFAVPIIQLREILLAGKIVPVPGAPLFVHGVINFRNNILLVSNIHHMLQLPFKKADKNYLLVTRNIALQAALLVDGIVNLVAVDQKDIKPKISRPMENNDPLIAGEIYYQKKLVTLLDLRGIGQWGSGHR